MPYFCGLDWGSVGHAVCVVDETGAVLLRFEVAHDAAGLAELRKKLDRLAPAGDIPIAIERPSGLIVDALVEAGHTVVPIHPNVVKACRPRYRAAGGKSDPGDAFMLADILRTDGHRFRPLAPCSDEIKALRALVRGRDELVAERIALANRLRSLLDSFWPGAAAIFADVDSPIALAFLQRYPTPESATRLGEKRVKAFLASNAYCGRRSPAELLARLRTAPTGLAAEAEAEAKGEMVGAFAAVLERLVGEIAKLTSRIQNTVAELPDGQIVMSFPRTGRICAAQILAELGPDADGGERRCTQQRAVRGQSGRNAARRPALAAALESRAGRTGSRTRASWPPVREICGRLQRLSPQRKGRPPGHDQSDPLHRGTPQASGQRAEECRRPAVAAVLPWLHGHGRTAAPATHRRQGHGPVSRTGSAT